MQTEDATFDYFVDDPVLNGLKERSWLSASTIASKSDGLGNFDNVSVIKLRLLTFATLLFLYYDTQRYEYGLNYKATRNCVRHRG